MNIIKKIALVSLVFIVIISFFNTAFADETWWFKGSNGSWLYKPFNSEEYTESPYEWATISVGAVYYPSGLWGKQRARVFARPDAVKLTYGKPNVYVSDIKTALKDINGTGNTYDSLTITEGYPLPTTSSTVIDSLHYTLAGYIWNNSPIVLDIVSNYFATDEIDHWVPSSAPERERRIMVSDKGLLQGLDNVSLPLKDNYGYDIHHYEADQYAEWFNVNGFTSTIIYQTPPLSGPYKLRAWGQVLYYVEYSHINVGVQSAYPSVDYYINKTL